MSLAALLHSKAASVALGTVAGVGIGVGALAYVHGGSTLTYSDGGAIDAVQRIGTHGPCSGYWELRDGMDVRKRRFHDDPSRPGELLTTFEDWPGKPVVEYTRDHVGLCIAGEVGLFRENYRPAGPATDETVEGRSLLFVRYSRPGCEACAMRWVWLDRGTGDVVRLEDRSYDGTLVHAARLLARATNVEPAESPAPARSAPARNRMAFAEFVAKVPVPVYEPARLPAGFRRVYYDLGVARSKSDPDARPIDLACIAYSDGVARIVLLLASPGDMKELEERARKQQSRAAAGETCASAESLPELLAGGDVSVLVKRHADKCRTVLRRDFEPDASVALIGFNEIPNTFYEEMIGSLVRVPAPR